MSDFLYPMLGGGEDDAAALLRDLARSAREKTAESDRTRRRALADLAPALDAAAQAMADAFTDGARLFCFGNGGSATDAAGLATLFTAPRTGRPLPARSLAQDPAVLTALANDVGIEVVFARQLEAHGRPGDVAVGLSTSGGSANVLHAFAAARRARMLTVGMAGYGGGAMRDCPHLDHCLAVDAQSIHRTQETQAALAHALWSRVQEHLERVGAA